MAKMKINSEHTYFREMIQACIYHKGHRTNIGPLLRPNHQKILLHGENVLEHHHCFEDKEIFDPEKSKEDGFGNSFFCVHMKHLKSALSN